MVGVINLSDGRFHYAQKGFTSIINELIELCVLHYNKYNNLNIHMSDPRVEVYFDLPKYDLSVNNYYNVSNEFFNNYLPLYLKNGIPEYNSHNIVNESDIKIRNFIFNNVFKLKNTVIFNQDKYDIGLHIRGTDKKNEIPELTCDLISNKLFDFLNKNKSCSNIFISTDEYKYIEHLKSKFNNIHFYSENTFSFDGNPIHFSGNRTILDYQVLRDVYTLKNCNNLFYCYSNVSLMAIMIGYETYHQKNLLN